MNYRKEFEKDKKLLHETLRLVTWYEDLDSWCRKRKDEAFSKTDIYCFVHSFPCIAQSHAVSSHILACNEVSKKAFGQGNKSDDLVGPVFSGSKHSCPQLCKSRAKVLN